jgi:hypothetical protein
MKQEIVKKIGIAKRPTNLYFENWKSKALSQPLNISHY